MSNIIKIGTQDVTLKVGSSPVTAAYLGSTQVYPEEQPVTDFKYKLTLSDSSVISAACDGTSAITQAEISAYTSTLTSAEIGDCVTSIGTYAFDSCYNLTSIDIPNSVASIGDRAFQYCIHLTSIDIPNSVTSIGEYAFLSCSGLISIEMPNSVTSIGGGAFQGCSSLTNVTIGSGVTSIGWTAFYNCYSLASITVNAVTPPSLGGGSVFEGSTCPIYVPCESVEAYKSAWSAYASRIQCNEPVFEGKYKLTLSDSSTVSAECNSNTALTSSDVGSYTYSCVEVTIGNCVANIGGGCFNGFTKLSAITFSNSVTTIGNSSFSQCNKLVSVNIPDSVTTIDDYGFYSCTGLTDVIIGSGCISIGASAFRNCTRLTSIIVESTTPPALGGNALNNTNNCPIYVPCQSLSLYQQEWADYASRITCIP